MKCLGKAATECSQHQHGAESAWEQQPGTGGHPGRMETPQHPERRRGGKRGDRCCSGARAARSSQQAQGKEDHEDHLQQDSTRGLCTPPKPPN